MPTIDRKDLITEADLDTEDIDDLDTTGNEVSLEDLNIIIDYEVDYDDSRGSYDV